MNLSWTKTQFMIGMNMVEPFSTTFLTIKSNTASMMMLNSYISSEMMATESNNLKKLYYEQQEYYSSLLFLLMSSEYGMTPNMFSSTSHIIFTASLSLPLSMFTISSSTTFSKKKTIAHLLLDSAPLWLNPFLVLVDTTTTTSNLMFRLAANMTGGHVVMNLMSSFSMTTTITTLYQYQ